MNLQDNVKKIHKNYCDVKHTRYIEPFNLHTKKYSEWLANPSGKYFFIVPIANIFNCEDKILEAKNNENVYVLFSDVLEGYALRYFPKLYECTQKYDCNNKIYFATGLYQAEAEYNRWLREKKLKKTFEVFYYPEWYHRVYDNYYDQPLNDIHLVRSHNYFCCLNNRPRAHRMQTVAYLNHLGLLRYGKVSCLDNHYERDTNKLTPEQLLFPYSQNYSDKHKQILKEQETLLWKKLPLNIDTTDFSQGCRPHDYNREIYDDCFLNIVTETHYHEVHQKHYHIFLSEKMWKPIACKQAFIVIGPRNTLQYLKKLGFKTFSCIINESYDSEDENTRLFSAIDALKEAMEKYDRATMIHLTKDIRRHNLEHFLRIQKQMVKTCW